MRGFFSSASVTKEKPAGRLPMCGACKLHLDCKSPKLEPYGHGTEVLLLGDHPSETDDRNGSPFCDEAGDFVHDVLSGLGVDMEADTVASNALICHRNRKGSPTLQELSFCAPNLNALLRKRKPKVVITMGRAATMSMVRKSWQADIGELARWVGWQIPVGDYWVCPTFDPHVLVERNNRVMDRLFEQHVEAALDLRVFGPPPRLEDLSSRIELLYDDKDVEDALADLESAGGLQAFDYETNTLKPEWERSKIYSCAVSNGKRTVSYLWTPRARKATKAFLRSKRVRKVAANMKFEERWTRHEFGVGVRGWEWDTMLATHCLDNRPGICSLKFQALVQFGIGTYNKHIEPYLKQSSDGPYNRIHKIPVDELLLYGGYDALIEFMLAVKQRKQMGVVQ